MVVRMRHTRGHTRNRRSHHKAEHATLTTDTVTNSTHQRHRVDMVTGMYRGRSYIDVVAQVEKKQKRARGTES